MVPHDTRQVGAFPSEPFVSLLKPMGQLNNEEFIVGRRGSVKSCIIAERGTLTLRGLTDPNPKPLKPKTAEP